MRWAVSNRIVAVLGNRQGPIPYLVSTALVAIVFLIRLAAAPLIGDRAPLLPFIVAVILAAGLYGVGPGLLAMILSAILATWVFIIPAVDGNAPEQIANVVIFLLTGGAMLLFANHLRETRTRAEKLELELMQAQANAAMGTMAGTLAHELNQPLAAAANYVAACQQLAALPEQKPQTLVNGLQQAESQIQRAGEIIRHARTLVRNSPVEREPSSLRRMFRRAIEVVKASDVGRNVRFETEISGDVDAVEVNSIQIEQVLLNLLRNACQSIGNSRPAEVRLKATATEKGKLIEVRDMGSGIPSDRLPTLFSATKPSANGLGLGLSISRTIVEAHGGSIWARNNPEGGASFFVLLPGSNPTEVSSAENCLS